MNSSVYTSGQLMKLTGLLEQHGVTVATFNPGLTTGLLSDVAESMAKGGLTNVDRNRFREILGLPPISQEMELDYGMPMAALVRKIDPTMVQHALTEAEKGGMAGKAAIKFPPLSFGRYADIHKVRVKLRRKKIRAATTFETLWYVWMRPEILSGNTVYSIGTPVTAATSTQYFRRIKKDETGNVEIHLSDSVYDMNQNAIILGVEIPQ